MPETFHAQLRDLGLCPGDVVLMHSSMKALGTRRAPAEFLEDILDVLGPDGTLLLPALTYENVSASQPLFRLRETEPCIGLLPRVFFHMDGVVRSLHPTHSVCAYGRHAAELTARHERDDTPVGPHSPFMRLMEYDGKLLFIGDILKRCTFMHGVEEVVGAPYTLSAGRTHFILEDASGERIEKDMRTHAFVGWNQEYQRISGILSAPDIRTGKVGAANCSLIDSRALYRRAIETFREDMFFFVSPLPREG